MEIERHQEGYVWHERLQTLLIGECVVDGCDWRRRAARVDHIDASLSDRGCDSLHHVTLAQVYVEVR